MVYLAAYQIKLIHHLFKAVAFGIHQVQAGANAAVAIVLHQCIYIAMYVVGIESGLVKICRVIIYGNIGVGYPVAEVALLKEIQNIFCTPAIILLSSPVWLYAASTAQGFAQDLHRALRSYPA